MEFMEKNLSLFVFITFVLLIVVFFFLLIVMFKVARVSNYTIDSQIKIKSNIELESETNKMSLKVTLFNSSFKDVNIISCGFIYKNQKIDFCEELKNEIGNDKIIIFSRDYITHLIKIERFEELLNIIAYKTPKTYKIKAYIIDSIGTEKVFRANALTKVIKQRNKERILDLKQQNKEIEQMLKTK